MKEKDSNPVFKPTLIMTKVFLSYVRGDTEADTGRLADTLNAQLPGINLFLDVDDVGFGENWQRIVARAIEDSVVLLCVMGPGWKTSEAVELELDLAFKSNVPVVPVLFRKANFAQLTNDLRSQVAELKYRNAITIEHGTWLRDVAPLIDLLKKIISNPSHARVITDPPDPKRLLEIEPSFYDVKHYLNYAQDLAECLADEEVYTQAKEAAQHFETERKRKLEYDDEMRNLWGAYRNIRHPEPMLIQIVHAARERLKIEQHIRDLFENGFRENDHDLVMQIPLYLDDDALLLKLKELKEQFRDSVEEYKTGGWPMYHPNEAKAELDKALTEAKKRLKAEIPGITKRYPDRKWPK